MGKITWFHYGEKSSMDPDFSSWMFAALLLWIPISLTDSRSLISGDEPCFTCCALVASDKFRSFEGLQQDDSLVLHQC